MSSKVSASKASNDVLDETLFQRVAVGHQQELSYYIVHAQGVDREKVLAKIKTFKSPKTKKLTMSIAEHFREMGFAEGETKGKSEGKVEGKSEGMLAGMIRGIQMMLGVRPTSERTLFRKTREELQAMFDALVAREPRLARAL
jgi:flagellar biosynthesis/type III secretory pathway protein FliH